MKWSLENFYVDFAVNPNIFVDGLFDAASTSMFKGSIDSLAPHLGHFPS